MAISYNPHDFVNERNFPDEGLWLRYAVVQSVNPTTGLVNLEWLDYPGVRTDIAITQSAQGTFDIPTIGALVIVGFDQGFKAQILRHLPAGYAKQIADSTIRGLKPGDKYFTSHVEQSDRTGEFPLPISTGTLLHMNNVGDIELATASGERWFMNNAQNEIAQSSMNSIIETEAGVLQFGLTKRLMNEDDTATTIIDTDGNPFPRSLRPDPDSLTEFRLRVLDKADANYTTAPEVEDPYIELTLGVKVDEAGDIVKTNSTHSVADKEILIQLKTKAGKFEFTVDRDGNFTVHTDSDIKIKAGGKLDIHAAKDIEVTSKTNINVHAENISLVGDKAVVLENFIDKFNAHTHTATGPTAPTTIPVPQTIKEKVVSKKVKVE